MHYWIENNGERLGPMRAIDVLRRAQANIRVYDGENWFWLDDGPDTTNASGAGSNPRTGERVIIQKAAN